MTVGGLPQPVSWDVLFELAGCPVPPPRTKPQRSSSASHASPHDPTPSQAGVDPPFPATRSLATPFYPPYLGASPNNGPAPTRADVDPPIPPTRPPITPFYPPYLVFYPPYLALYPPNLGDYSLHSDIAVAKAPLGVIRATLFGNSTTTPREKSSGGGHFFFPRWKCWASSCCDGCECVGSPFGPGGGRSRPRGEGVALGAMAEVVAAAVGTGRPARVTSCRTVLDMEGWSAPSNICVGQT